MEAMAVGLPVIATRHAGIPELVEDGICGLLVGEGDADALAAAFATLIRDSVLRGLLGAAGRRRVEAGFDSGDTDAQTLGVYRAVAAGVT